jgi:hypothetical protein
MTGGAKWSTREEPSDVLAGFYQEFKAIWGRSAASGCAIAQVEEATGQQLHLLIEDIHVALSALEGLITGVGEYIDHRIVGTETIRDPDLDVLMMVTHDLAVPVSRGKTLSEMLMGEEERGEQQSPKSSVVLIDYLNQIARIVGALDTHRFGRSEVGGRESE